MTRPGYLVIGSLMAFPSAGAAILIDNFSSRTNDRFQDVDSPDEFIAAGYDLSGVGQDSSGRWATLIGPNTIISANHFQPSGTVSFYPGNDPGATTIDIGITTDTLRIGDTDLWIARLAEYAPPTVSAFGYATTANGPPGDPVPYNGQNVFMTGRSETGFTAIRDQAYGTNVISGFDEDNTATSLGTLDVLELGYDAGATTYEAFLQVGDSGAPLFVDDGSGNLLLLGVNSFITTTDPGGDPVASYVSYTGNDSTAMDAQVAAWAAIPEPSTTLLLGGSLMLVFRRRRGSRATGALHFG